MFAIKRFTVLLYDCSGTRSDVISGKENDLCSEKSMFLSDSLQSPTFAAIEHHVMCTTTMWLGLGGECRKKDLVLWTILLEPVKSQL